MQVRNEVKTLTNIIGILEKIEYDQNLDFLGAKFSEILEKETIYAKNGYLKRIGQAELWVNESGVHKPDFGEHPDFQREFEDHSEHVE